MVERSIGPCRFGLHCSRPAQRRIVFVRWRIHGALTRESLDTSGQLRLMLAEQAVVDVDPMWDTVLVTGSLTDCLSCCARITASTPPQRTPIATMTTG